MGLSQTDHRALRPRLRALLDARQPLVVVDTVEEQTALGVVVGAAVEVGKPVLTWSVVRGITEGVFAEEHRPRPDTQLPAAAMRNLVFENGPRVVVMLDLPPHLDDAVNARCLRELVDHCRLNRATLVLVHDGGVLPPALGGLAMPFTIPLPDHAELDVAAREILRRLKDDEHIDIRIRKHEYDALIANLGGLTRRQAEQLVHDVALGDGILDGFDVEQVLERKRVLFATDGVLEALKGTVDLDDVAGFSNFKAWISRRRSLAGGALPSPRGVLLLGVPGSGKSLCAKALSVWWKRPLLRLDAGALYDKYIGESERRLRASLRQAEAMAPCVLWIDEIEKAFASASGRSSDGGLSQRMFGTLLTWMQEHRSDLFLVATANDIEALPPELLRKGRFDQIFFADLPDHATRVAVLEVHCRLQGISCDGIDLDAVAEGAAGFSGAELEQALISARFVAAECGRPLDAAILLDQIRASPPLAATAAETVERLRDWAQGRCVPA